jgi:hypothetical protein
VGAGMTLEELKTTAEEIRARVYKCGMTTKEEVDILNRYYDAVPTFKNLSTLSVAKRMNLNK